jgi:uncharacterized membrane protein HdeD (DUF308 family)
MTKNIGNLLLAIWLILTGLKTVFSFSLTNHDGMVLGILAIVAGVLLVLRR